jgi:hypothetical protein
MKYLFLPNEIIFLTVHYACEHDMCRPVFRDKHPGDERTLYSPDECKHCILRTKRAYERRMEKLGGRL